MYGRPVGRLLGAFALVLVLSAPATAAEPASLGVAPFTLSADAAAKKVNVAVDAQGAGHFAWDVQAAGGIGPDPLAYCRVPRGATACQIQHSFPLPLSAFGEPQVLAASGVVVLLAYRCCGTGEGTWGVFSTDGGTSFEAPRLVSTVAPGQAVFGPGANVSIVNDVHTLGIDYQSVSLTGPPPPTSANVGDGPSQSYDGTIGFAAANVPLVAFDDLTNGFFREWSGAGDVNDLATWRPTQPLGPLTELRIATGPKGTVLIGKQRDASFRSSYVARRFDAATHAFGPPVAVSDRSAETDVIFRDTFQDAGGNTAAVWIANGVHPVGVDPMRYRVSTDGGLTWRAERTLLAATDDQAFNLQMGAAPDGGGFVAWDGNGRGPVRAVPIPPIAQQGLPAPVAGKTMNAAVVSGTVRVNLPGPGGFVPLTAGTSLPVGTVIDTTKGVVSLTAAGTGRTYKGRFSRGQFRISQKARALYKGKLHADLTLTGPPLGCGASKAEADGGAARRRRVRFLLAKASGRFRTIGRKSFGTERGTTWLTKDSCAGTLTQVRAGRVWIFDFARKKTVELNAGQSYLATGRRRG